MKPIGVVSLFEKISESPLMSDKIIFIVPASNYVQVAFIDNSTYIFMTTVMAMISIRRKETSK